MCEYHDPSECRQCGAGELAAQMLNDRGIPFVYEPFDGSMRLEDDGCVWYFGVVNETWGADIIRQHSNSPQDDEYIGAAYTSVDSDSDDPWAIADAIEAAVNRMQGVELWRERP